MSVLGHDAILAEIENGRIYVDPFDPALVKTNSIDVRLADEAYAIKPVVQLNQMVDPYSPSKDQFYKLGTESLGWIRQHHRQNVAPGIAEDVQAFRLAPGHYIMRTMEWIGTVPGSGLLPDLDSKSTTARWGLTTAICSGRGDVGFTGIWGLSVRVLHPTLLIPGSVVSQVRFTRVEGDNVEFAYGGEDSYQPDKGTIRILPKPLKVRLPDNSG